MLPLLQSIFGAATGRTRHPAEAAVDAAIETAVDGTDPRIRMVGGYRKRLRDAVVCALGYLEELVEGLPGPVRLERRSFGANPYVHAYFGSADQIEEVIRGSESLRKFRSAVQEACAESCYALLAMRRHERTVLGVAQVGDVIRRDVKQLVVSFSDHLFVAPAGTIEGARQELKERAFADLVELALARIVALRTQRREFEQRRHLLRTKLCACRAAAVGLQPLTRPSYCDPVSRQRVEQELSRVEQGLEASAAELGTLGHYIEQVNQVLSRPRDHLWRETVALRLNRMGVSVSPGAMQPADSLSVAEIEVKDTLRVAVSWVSLATTELEPRRDFAANLDRFLSTRI